MTRGPAMETEQQIGSYTKTSLLEGKCNGQIREPICSAKNKPRPLKRIITSKYLDFRS
jgi:hypothetical protein